MDPTLPDANSASAEPIFPAEPVQLSDKGLARRRLGLGASGVILTLASKSGMATGTSMYCGTASGWHSASTASRQKSTMPCGGMPASYWKQKSWPSGCSTSAMFSSLFPEGRGTFYIDTSLATVFLNTNTATDPSLLRREFIIAYLNAAYNLNKDPSTAELKNIWKNYVLNGGRYVMESTGQTLSASVLQQFLAASHS